MDRLLPLPDEDDRVAAWVGRLRGQKEEKADAAAMRAASMIVRTMVAQVLFWGVRRNKPTAERKRVADCCDLEHHKNRLMCFPRLR